MSSLEKILSEIGLTENEVLFYQTLLLLKQANAAEVAAAANMDKSSGYRAAQTLLHAGLIVETGERYNSKLFIEDINRVKALLQKKEQKISAGIASFDEFVKTLPDLMQSEYLRSKVRVYYDADGVKRVYEERLLEESGIIRELSSNEVQQNLTPADETYWLDYIKRRKQAGLLLHMLVDEGDDSVKFHRTNKEQFKEARQVPKDFIFTSGLSIYGTKVAIHNTEKSSQVVTIIIDDKTIAQLFMAMFDFIWNRSRQV